MKSLIFTIALTFVAACSPTQELHPTLKETPKSCCKDKASPAPELTSEEMMKAIEEAGKRTKEHENLDPLVGKFSTIAKFWMSPEKTPEIQKGTAEHKWILTKRFIEQDYQSKWGGKPFKGKGFLGYDSVKQHYVDVWMDTTGTGMQTSKGSFDAEKKILTMQTEYTCPVTREKISGRTVTTIISQNEHVFEMYSMTPSGEEIKMMEISYKRR